MTESKDVEMKDVSDKVKKEEVKEPNDSFFGKLTLSLNQLRV